MLGWTVAVGDHVKAGDTVVEISTDKVDVELPAPASGTITELLAGEGDTVAVGQVIGRMAAGAAPPRPRRPAPLPPPPPTAATAATPRYPPARATARRLPPSRDGPPPPWMSTSARSPEPASTGGSSRPTCSMPPPGRAPQLPRPRAKTTVLKGGAAVLAQYMDESREIPTATTVRTIVVDTLDAAAAS